MASWANVLLGLWLVIAPWVLGYAALSGVAAVEAVIVGILVLCVASVSGSVSGLQHCRG